MISFLRVLNILTDGNSELMSDLRYTSLQNFLYHFKTVYCKCIQQDRNLWWYQLTLVNWYHVFLLGKMEIVRCDAVKETILYDFTLKVNFCTNLIISMFYTVVITWTERPGLCHQFFPRFLFQVPSELMRLQNRSLCRAGKL